MSLTTPTTEGGSSIVGVREAQRLETRARVFDAAVAEIGRAGLTGADVSAIARAAGVVRGTVYFHFPTKEHVLVELERAEEAKIIAKRHMRSGSPNDLASMLTGWCARCSRAITGQRLPPRKLPTTQRRRTQRRLTGPWGVRSARHVHVHGHGGDGGDDVVHRARCTGIR